MDDDGTSNEAITFDYDSRLYWPAVESTERCFKYMMDRVCDVDYLVKHTPRRGIVVQAGGFVGMWPLRLAKTFERVYTFEPMTQLFEALSLNTKHAPGIIAENCALSNTNGQLPVEFHRSGCSRVNLATPNTVRCRTIDSLKLVRCDALYLDVEMHELAVLDGAEDTVAKFSPTIMLETHPDHMTSQNEWMRKHRYKMVSKVHSDRVFIRETK